MVYTFVVFGLECNFPAHSHQALRQESYSKLHISWGACGARPSSANNENDIVKTGPVNVDKDLNRQQGMCQAFTVDGEAAMALIWIDRVLQKWQSCAVCYEAFDCLIALTIRKHAGRIFIMLIVWVFFFQKLFLVKVAKFSISWSEIRAHGD